MINLCVEPDLISQLIQYTGIFLQEASGADMNFPFIID